MIDLEFISILEQIPAAITKAIVEVMQSYPNHPGRPGGGSMPRGQGGAIIEGAKKKFMERASKLGYKSVQFKQGKDGNIEIHAGGLKGGKLKKTKAYIDKEGRIISGKMMMTESGWGQIK